MVLDMAGSNTEKHTDNDKSTEHTFSERGITRFGERLTQVINGESYKSFAKKCEMSDKAIRDYVSGKTYPALDRIAHIAKVAGCSFEWLATGINPQALAVDAIQGAKSIDESDWSQTQKDLSNILGRLTEDEQEKIIQHIIKNGTNSLIPEESNQRAMAIASLVVSLSDKDQREILHLIETKKLGSLLDNTLKSNKI